MPNELDQTKPIDPIVEARAAGRYTPVSQRARRKQRRRRQYDARGPPDDDAADVDAYSIAAFCRRHSISESFYHKLRSQPQAVRERVAFRNTSV